jgi:hypothetical protein
MAVKDRTVTGLLLAVTAVLALTGCGSTDTAPSVGAGVWDAADTTAPELPDLLPEPGHTLGESAYLDTLDMGDVTYSSDDAALTAGEAICDFLRGGGSSLMAVDIVLENTGYTSFEAGYIVGAAQGALCPEMAGA